MRCTSPDHKPQPRKRNRAACERALTDAALSLFSEQGFETTTTREIGARAGCSEALIQRYFGSKAGLLIAVIRNEECDRAFTDFRDGPIAQDLTHELRNSFSFLMRHMDSITPRLRVLMARALVDTDFRKEFAELPKRGLLLAYLTMRLEACEKKGWIEPGTDISAAAFMMITLCFQTSFIMREAFDIPCEERTRTAMDMLTLCQRGIERR